MRLSQITSDVIGEAAKEPTLPSEGGKIEVQLNDGSRGTVDESDLSEVLQTGGRVVPAEEIKQEGLLAEAADKPISAFAASTLREATYGLSDKLLTESGLAKPEELVALEQANPASTVAGQVVGTVAPLALSGGLGIAGKIASATPVLLAEKAGEKIAGKIAGKVLSKTTSKTVENALKLGVGSAVDAGLYGVGQTISEDALGKAEFNAENLLANVGKSALTGGVFGASFGALSPSVGKALDKATNKANQLISDFANKGDVGILKWAGADKRHFKKIYGRSGIDEKDVADHLMSLTKGGGEDLKGLIQTSIEDVADKNAKFIDDAGERMNASLKAINDEFEILKNAGESKIGGDALIYGQDLAKTIEEKVLSKLEGISSPRKAAIEKIRDELSELGIVRDELGNFIKREPLSPDQIKRQSIEFGKLAKFDAQDTLGTREVYKELRFDLEDKLSKLMEKVDGGKGLYSVYKKAKRDYEKGLLTQEIIENGLAKEVANNRGMSLTESLSAVAGGVVGGLPGAVAGYALRRGMREHGDKMASYVISKIERANNRGKINISDAVDEFLKVGKMSGKVAEKAAIRSVIASDVKDEQSIEDKVSYYSQSPDAIVNKFVETNPDLFKVAPKTAAALQARLIKAAEFLNEKAPKKDLSTFGDTRVSRSDLLKFKNYVEAVEQPAKVLQNLKNGYFTPESGEVFKIIYPETYNQIKNEFLSRMNEFKKL